MFNCGERIKSHVITDIGLEVKFQIKGRDQLQTYTEFTLDLKVD